MAKDDSTDKKIDQLAAMVAGGFADVHKRMDDMEGGLGKKLTV